MHNVRPKPLCSLLAVLLLFEWSGMLGWRDANGQLAVQTHLGLPSSVELAQAQTALAQTPRVSVTPHELVTWSDALSRGISRVRYDLAARAQSVGSGADPAFLFVRDQIRFEAYPGVLRGAEGTYVTRTGNAFDRSLLLAELLKRKGIRTRFAMGRLPRQQTERLFGRIFEAERPLEADAVSTTTGTRSPEAQAFEARLRARAVRDYGAIRKALGGALPFKASSTRWQPPLITRSDWSALLQRPIHFLRRAEHESFA